MEGSRAASIGARSAKELIDSVHAEVGSRSIAELEAQRDAVLLGLLELRSQGRENVYGAESSRTRRLTGFGYFQRAGPVRCPHIEA